MMMMMEHITSMTDLEAELGRWREEREENRNCESGSCGYAVRLTSLTSAALFLGPTHVRLPDD